MPWKLARASRREARSTKRRWVASRPKPEYFGQQRPAEPARRVPPGVERRHLRQRGELRGQRLVRVDDRARDLQVLVDHLAGHEEVHDLGRALEDLVDAEVAHHALDGDRARRRARRATARSRSRGRRGSASSRRRSPRPRYGVPLLRRRRLEADVVAAAVGHLGREVRDRLHREGARRDVGDLVRDRLVLADGLAPLHALVRPAAARSRGTPSRCRRRCSGSTAGRR